MMKSIRMALVLLSTLAIGMASANASTLFEDDFSNGATRDGWVQKIAAAGTTTFGYDGVATIVPGHGQPSSLWHNFSDTVLQQGETLSLTFDVMMSRTTAQGAPIRFGLGFSSSPLVDGANSTTPVDGYMSSAPFLGHDKDVVNYWMDGDPGGINWGNALTVAYAEGALDNNDAYTVTNAELRTVTYEITRSASDVLSAVTSVNGEYSGSTVLTDQITDFKFNAVGFMAPYNSGNTFTYDNLIVEAAAPLISVVNTAGAALPDTGSPPPHDLENNPYVMSFDAGATADKLIVQLSGETSGGAIVVTYNGEALALAAGSASGRNQGIYYLDNPYTGGAADLIVDMTAKDVVNGIGLGVVSISGSAPGVDATANDSSNSVTITPTLDGSFVMAGWGAQGASGNGSVDAPLTELYGGAIGSAEGGAGYINDVVAMSQSYSFSGGNDPRGSSAAAFAPATAAIPEPSTFVLAALGLLGLSVVARRRKPQQ